MTGRRRRLAFEAFVDFVMARWQAIPDMHVYHYAAYERGRMGMLSTRHATREAEVDRMLTAELFVDLYKVVRQSMRIGLDSYSIKRLEPLYALDREAPLKDAGSSIVAYERYIRSVSAGTPDTGILEEIRLYNQDDCRSNAELRDWLEEQRTALALQLGMTDLDRRTPPEEKERPSSQRDERVANLARQLLDGIPRIRSDGRRPCAAGALAAGEPARVAPPRGEGGLVGLLRPLHPLGRGARHLGRRGNRPDPLAVRGGPPQEVRRQPLPVRPGAVIPPEGRRHAV